MTFKLFFGSILCFFALIPVAFCQCDDNTVTVSVSASDLSCGDDEIVLTFEINGQDDDDDISILYSFNNQNFTLNNVTSNQQVTHTVTRNSVVELISVTVKEEDDDDDICTLTVNKILEIPVPAQPEIRLEVQQPSCGVATGSVKVIANGGNPPYLFQLDNRSPQSNDLFENLSPGRYNFTVIDENTCENSATITVEDAPDGNLLIEVFDIILPDCENENGRFSIRVSNGTEPFQYSIDGNNFQSSNTIVNLGPGKYKVEVKDQNNCRSTIEVELEAKDQPLPIANPDGPLDVDTGKSATVDVLKNDEIRQGVFVEIIKAPASGKATITSSGLEYTPEGNVSGRDTLYYRICLESCIDLCDDTFVIFNVKSQDGDNPMDGNVCNLDEIDTNVVFPEGITPNGDGFNEALAFKIIDKLDCPINYAESDITIFNRWGDKVYFEAPYNNSWNGHSNNGNVLPPGVYYYVLRVRRENKKDYIHFGHVSIFR